MYRYITMASQASFASSITDDVFNDDFVNELEPVEEIYFGNTEFLENENGHNDSDSDADYDDSVDVESECCEHIAPECSVKEQNIDNICRCSKLYGNPCLQMIDSDKLGDYRDSCIFMSRSELDIVIKHQLLHCVKHKYFLFGAEVCRDTYAFAHGITRKTVNAIVRDLKENGVEARTHGNKNKMPKHALSLEDVKAIKQFLLNFGQQNGVPLPGKHANFRNEKCFLLPSDLSKADIHEMYNNAAEQASFRKVCLSEFKKIWQQQRPYLIIMKPATDLCLKCQLHVSVLSKLGNVTEEDKLAKIDTFNIHIGNVKKERDYIVLQESV